MEKKPGEKEKGLSVAKEGQKKMGRPPSAEVQKKSIEVTVEGDFVVIKVPRKDLTKKLLADLI